MIGYAVAQMLIDAPIAGAAELSAHDDQWPAAEDEPQYRLGIKAVFLEGNLISLGAWSDFENTTTQEMESECWQKHERGSTRDPPSGA